MSTLQLIMAIAVILISLGLIIIILMQKNREADASAVQGSNPTVNSNAFFDKGGSHAKDDTLSNITKVLGILLFAVSIATTCIILFV